MTTVPAVTTLSLSDNLKDFSARLIACFAILWTPFFVFSNFRGHPIPVTALIYSAMLFTLVALVFTLCIGREKSIRRIAVFTLIIYLFFDLQAPWFNNTIATVTVIIITCVFWLLREHLALILATIFSTILITSTFPSPEEQYVNHTMVSNQGSSDAIVAPGMVIHLILDEFTGLPGIPENITDGQALKLEITDFFHSYGFTLYNNAISEFLSSKVSISGILNFEASSTPEKHFYGKRPFVVKNNAYFERLYQRHYKINVYQSTYLDYCTRAPVPLASCFTYRYDSTDWLRTAALSDFQKMSALLSMHLNRSDLLESIWKSYIKLSGHILRIGISLPGFMIWDGTVAPLSAMPAFDHFRESVLKSPQGSAHFAHLLLPHSPYVYEADCSLRDHPLDWLSNHPLHEKDNTEAGRKLRYQQYFSQLRCTLRQLQLLFDELKANDKWVGTKIILHGDHGSRIYETAPRKSNMGQLTTQDLIDGFSTLFAVKSLQTQAIVDDRAVPVSQLLAEMAGATGTQFTARTQNPFIYIEGKNNEPWTAIPWQDLP